ncbi:MAG TPA: small acid-soluble spore protein Tlp [Bacillales bacterium]|nr:small acid-soluble spore protein Tlp [Bacillales bacterium]
MDESKRPKPDDRSDNVEKLQQMVHDTIENIEAAHETLQNDDLSENQRQEIIAKNERREQSLRGMREELKDEAHDQKNK